jgi:predicted nucleic acid-binding protein
VTLIDTSSWIEFLRHRENPTSNRVLALVASAQAAWCDLVAVELWAGVRDGRERRELESLEREITNYPLDAESWVLSRKLAFLCRRSGLNVPTVDVIVCACAHRYAVELEADDSHFRRITALLPRL